MRIKNHPILGELKTSKSVQKIRICMKVLSPRSAINGELYSVCAFYRLILEILSFLLIVLFDSFGFEYTVGLIELGGCDMTLFVHLELDADYFDLFEDEFISQCWN